MKLVLRASNEWVEKVNRKLSENKCWVALELKQNHHHKCVMNVIIESMKLCPIAHASLAGGGEGDVWMGQC